jgi:hypothetical protein
LPKNKYEIRRVESIAIRNRKIVAVYKIDKEFIYSVGDSLLLGIEMILYQAALLLSSSLASHSCAGRIIFSNEREQ